ncbi:MAG: CBS domain-containing protein [Thermocladium sp.]
MVLYAKDIMKKYTKQVDGGLTALDGAKIMAEDHVGFLIIREEGKPVGIVTEWDYVSKIVAKGIDPSKVLLRDIMTKPLTYIDPNTPTDQVATLMAQKGIRRLPVIDNGELVGVVTSRDILRIFREYVDKITTLIASFST